MGHVVDEVVFHLGEFFLTECYDYRADKHHEQDKCKRDGREHERDRRVDVVVFRREIYFQECLTVARVVGKECLHECAFALGCGLVVADGAVERGAGAVEHGKFKRNCETEGVELLTQIVAYGYCVGALEDWPGCGLAYDVDYHLVEHVFLLKVAVAYFGTRALVGVCRHVGRRLQARYFRGVAFDVDVGLQACRCGETVAHASQLRGGGAEILGVDRRRRHVRHFFFKEIPGLVLGQP